MENKTPKTGPPVRKLPALGPVTREMVRARTRELSLLAGRTALDISQADYEQAKRELTGESERDRQDAVLEGRVGLQ